MDDEFVVFYSCASLSGLDPMSVSNGQSLLYVANIRMSGLALMGWLGGPATVGLRLRTEPAEILSSCLLRSAMKKSPLPAQSTLIGISRQLTLLLPGACSHTKTVPTKRRQATSDERRVDKLPPHSCLCCILSHMMGRLRGSSFYFDLLRRSAALPSGRAQLRGAHRRDCTRTQSWP